MIIRNQRGFSEGNVGAGRVRLQTLREIAAAGACSILLLSACATAQHVAPAQTENSSPAAAQPTAAAPAIDPNNVFGFTDEDLKPEDPAALAAQRKEAYVKLVHELQGETEELWGAKVGHEIEPTVLDKQGLSDLLTRLLKEETDKPEAQGATDVMKFMELLPEDTDYGKMMQDLMEGQVGGLYNPEDKSLYVIDSFNPTGFIGKIILSHEIGHAIQDAHYDLTKWLEGETNLDTQKAKQCVVEGDATALMFEWAQKNLNAIALVGMLSELDQQMQQDLDNAPQPVVQDMIFSYIGGYTFLLAVQGEHPGDWRKFVFTHPPVSTEQILHPEKYNSPKPDLPMEVTLGKMAEDSGYKEIFRETFGEWNALLFLTLPTDFPKMNMLTMNVSDIIVNEPVATNAAAGWGGDELAMYTKEDGTRLLVWKTLWDSERDAAEFLDGLTRRMKAMHAFTNAVWGADFARVPDGRVAGFRRTGNRVDFIMATSENAMKDGVNMLEGPADNAK